MRYKKNRFYKFLIKVYLLFVRGRYFLYIYYNFKNKNRDFFDYKLLSKDYPVCNLRGEDNNNFYGHQIILEKYFNKRLRGVIEHGIYFGETILEEAYTKSKIIYTYSAYRKNVLEKKIDKKIEILGPYIKYADQYYCVEKLNQIKANLGKVLLIFPSHSVDKVNSQFNIKDFIQKVLNYSQNYDTVLICMYWKDINLKRDHIYIKHGFKIVTAGHRSDPKFLNRLKSIIYLADMVITNDIGTHVGYIISEKKPLYIALQKIKREGEGLEKEFRGRNNENYRLKLDKEKIEIANAFNFFDEKITEAQQKIIEKYWGKL